MNHRYYAELKNRNANTGGAFTAPLGIIRHSALMPIGLNRFAVFGSTTMQRLRLGRR